MTHPATAEMDVFPDPHQGAFPKTVFGFWIYLMTDSLIFATLFATYAVLHSGTFGGPSSNEIFNLKTTIAETAVLLVSSITCGFAVLSAVREKRGAALVWLIVSFLLGLTFVSLELYEFSDLVQKGYSWKRSAFLSSFFTLVGTHGFHVSCGLFWILILIVQIFFSGLTVHTFRRLVCFSMFWHFLDFVWIFIFTFVYLMGIL